MSGNVAYWCISVGFCAAWVWAVVAIWRSGWNRVCPLFSSWAAISTVQAIVTTVAGSHPSAWWTLYVWSPMEIAVLLALWADSYNLLNRLEISK